ncbi:MAG TPA: hypothetical protein VIY53_00630 [Acidobacteriaceae bacterium]
MATGLPAADSISPVTSNMIQSATNFYGATPAFWGRYFTSVSTGGIAEYHHATENGPLNSAGIRLLPVARQTKNVNGTAAQGTADGNANAQDFITTFGVDVLTAQGGSFYMFLDVESTPALSQAYYTGWAQGLAQESQSLSNGAVQVLPCVYGTQSDVPTWTAVAAAMSAGVPCGGAWIARYFSGQCAMGQWNDAVVTPHAPVPFPCPILAWQYAENCLNGMIDCSQTNPEIDVQNQLLKFLVLPPAS